MIKLYFSFLILSIQFKIKHADTDVYLCRKFSENRLPPIVSCSNIEEATDFKFDDNGNGTQQIITVDGTKALAIRSDNVVIVNDAEKQKSQEFIITKVESDKYTLKSYGKCVIQKESSYKIELCKRSGNQLFINVEAEIKPQVSVEPKTTVVKPKPTKQQVSNPTTQKVLKPTEQQVSNPTIDQSLLDKMQKTLDETKKLTRKILKSQKRHSIEGHDHLCHHHIHHHHFCEDDEYQIVERPILIKSKSKAKKHVYPSKAEHKYIVEETVPITRRDYALKSSHYTNSIKKHNTGTSLFDNLKN